MKLPVSSESYRPSRDAMIRAIKRSKLIFSRMIADETELPCGTVFTSQRLPGVRMANHALDVRIPEGADAASSLTELFNTFDANNVKCFSLHSVESGWPEPLPPLLLDRGYVAKTWSLYLLEQYKHPKRLNDELQIIPMRAAYPQARAFFREQAITESHVDDALADQLASARIDLLDEPRLDMYLGRLNQKAVGVAGVLTLGQVGVIHNVYTLPEYRGKAVAGTLMAHTIDHCQRALFEQVIVERAQGCSAIPFYESLGFNAVASYVQYRLP